MRRYLPIILFSLAAGGIALAGYLMPARTEQIPTRILLENTGGSIVFDHKEHAEKYNIPCARCHHESSAPEQQVMQCGLCHGRALDKAFIAEHPAAITDKKACVTCHHADMGKVKWSHADHAEQYASACTDCHHKPDIEPEPVNCGICHYSLPAGAKKPFGDMPAGKDALHKKCATCHQEWFDAGAKGCVSCHPTTKRAEHFAADKAVINPDADRCSACHTEQPAKLIPGRMDAFHSLCMKCHEAQKKGPFTKEQCQQCHTK